MLHRRYIGSEKMAIQESGENYLETILILKERNGYVRSIDIAHETGFLSLVLVEPYQY